MSFSRSLLITVTIFAILGVAAIIVSPAIWHELTLPTYTYRYRLTVNVDVDGHLRSNSSVIEVQLRKQLQRSLPVPPVLPRVQGEAVFVDLGAGRNLVALLASGPTGANVDFPHQIVPALTQLSYDDRDLEKFPHLAGGWKLSEAQMPTLVTFKDANAPKTASIVQPYDFGEVFGPAARLRDITLEMTNEPVTQSIKQHFRWIGNYSVETEFERALRAAEGGFGPSMTPGMNLKREK